jgi:hypothetical protein
MASMISQEGEIFELRKLKKMWVGLRKVKEGLGEVRYDA